MPGPKPYQAMKKWEDILTATALLWALLLLNIHSGRFSFRLDLTEDRRYTMADGTKHLLEGLDDVVYVEVYLDGELNAGFRRFREVIQETLEQFRAHAGERLQYRFIDPSDGPNPKAIARQQQELAARGLPPTYLDEQVDGQRVQRVIFPGAIVSYRAKETPVLLLKSNKGMSAEEQLNQSAEGVEYALASAIWELSAKARRRIALLGGHSELEGKHLADFQATLEARYRVDRVRIGQEPLEPYDAVVLVQPKERFSDREVFLLDQYIVGGGKALLLLDKVQMNLDSIAKGGTYAFGYDLGLEDLLFRYGLRLNNDLIQDQQAGLIEVVAGNFGDKAQVQRYPWPYYVYLNTFSKHPMVRNLGMVYAKFLGTIDTVSAPGVRKTPLIFTSPYTRVKPAPTMVDLNELKGELRQPGIFNRQGLPVAYLLEGRFTSLYANQALPEGVSGRKILKEGESRIVVCSDADWVRSEINPRTGQPEPIDFDRLGGQPTSNKDFALHALAYLTGDSGLLEARKKELALRPLDRIRAKEERLFWQVLNVGVPVAAVALFGAMYGYWRRRRYRG
jgi:gliding-associated putative ABC transporter substrate-binding component GldG